MKHAHAKPTRAKRAPDAKPPLVRCGNSGCDRYGSRYEMKLHRQVCAHDPALNRD